MAEILKDGNGVRRTFSDLAKAAGQLAEVASTEIEVVTGSRARPSLNFGLGEWIQTVWASEVAERSRTRLNSGEPSNTSAVSSRLVNNGLSRNACIR